MDDETKPMPIKEKTIDPTSPPPLPQGSILTGDEKPAGANAPKPATAPPPTNTAPSPATAHAIAAVQAAAVMVQALPDQTRNVQTAMRMLNDATGLLQKA
jgi:hypothetical protein